MIKKFDQFIKEAYEELSTDSSSIIRSKKEVNNYKRWIDEYRQKANMLRTIYQTFEDDDDLLKKLKANKIIDEFELDKSNPRKVRETDIKDPNKIKFENPLLGELANIEEKNRMIKDLTADKLAQDKTISDRKREITGNERLRPSYVKDIEQMEEKLKLISKDIKELEKEIKDLKTNAQKKLTFFQRELAYKSRLLEDDIQDRRQPDITGQSPK